MHKQISSTQNPFIKQLFTLKEKSRNRKKDGKFLIEGAREIALAIQGNYEIDSLLFQPELFPEHQLEGLNTSCSKLFEVSKEVYQKLAHRETTEGVIALVNSKGHTLEALRFKNENPLILVAEAPEKPGNIGALLRTADAANLDAVIIANPKTDLYNPNIIRSSVGCVFTNQIAIGETSDIIRFLHQKGINIYCAALTAASNYHTQDYKQATAIVVGTEATGLNDEWLENSTQNIIIPMQGEIDSMNVSVAAAIIIFEAKRQRDFNQFN
ncbi:TrmH family RNA methyltransferase [Sungkyunkwania multivorans]|uniref:TrmH family RNA methyltransferase n=1 Tax=Sungkyunkwania multivorans TaxID=1173618 RepID=A0ABW3CUI4_9FLAO